jgi:peptidyl-prolyl cis-trans isomerase
MAKREYIQANKDWLEAKAQEEGVKALPKGIYYKVLAEGDAQSGKPSVRSIVSAHYTGKTINGKTINGKTFDSSRGGVPLACRLCDLIEGWIIAMQQMHIGDKWEVYIPAEMGYGKFSQPGIPGGSTLIFEIELLGIA